MDIFGRPGVYLIKLGAPTFEKLFVAFGHRRMAQMDRAIYMKNAQL